MEEAHSDLLFDALQASMRDPRSAADPDLAREYLRLFTAAARKARLFTPAQRAQLDGYGLWAVVRTEIATSDDSFEFNKVVGRVKGMIAELPEAAGPGVAAAAVAAEEAALAALLPPPDPERSTASHDSSRVWSETEALAMRRAALLDCVCGGGRESYGRPWAKTSVDLLVEHALAHAARFLPSQQMLLQEMAGFVRAQKTARKTVRRDGCLVLVPPLLTALCSALLSLSPTQHTPLSHALLPLSYQGPSAKDAARDTTSFEAAQAEWGRSTSVSARGKVGAGGDLSSTPWLG